MNAHTEQCSSFNLLLMGLKLVNVPVCRNETTTEVVSPWRSEVEVESCGELDCVTNISSVDGFEALMMKTYECQAWGFPCLPTCL